MTPKVKLPPPPSIALPKDVATNPPVESASRSASSPIRFKIRLPPSPGRRSTGNSSTSLAPITTPIKKSILSSSSSPSTPSTRVFSSPSATSITTTSPSSSVATSPSHKSPVSPPHNPYATPNYTSTHLPKSLLTFAESLTAQEDAYAQLSFFDFFDPFYGAMKQIDSLYGSQPPAAQIISSVLEWKNTPTITGLIICATETVQRLSFTVRLQILYMLAFASQDFTLKFSCLMSELVDATDLTWWLIDFISAVECKLKKGVTEMSWFDEEDQKKLMEAYGRKIKKTDLEIVRNPEDLVSQFSNHRSNILTNAHSMVKPDTIELWASKLGGVRSDSETGSDDDEFWNRS